MAKNLFKKAIAIDSMYPLFHYNLGITLKGERKSEESEKELEKAKELDYQSLRIKNAYKKKLTELSQKYQFP